MTMISRDNADTDTDTGCSKQQLMTIISHPMYNTLVKKY